MNISNMLKKVSFGCGLATLCVAFQASAAFCGDPCCPDPCCPAPCCEDGPLSCNAFGVQIKGGVTPAWFEDRGNNYEVRPSVSPSVIPLGKSAQFDKIFDTPWQVGAELQWNASTHVQFFAEYVYFQAEGKKHHFTLNDVELSRRTRNLETNAFYLGARYFFGNIWCSECGMGSVAPFIGFKGGLVWRNNTKNRVDDTVFTNLDVDRNNKNDRGALSAGVQVGLDWSINCNWGVVLTVEGVGTERFAGRRDLGVINPPAGGVTELHFGDHGKLITVPVTLGVRYTF